MNAENQWVEIFASSKEYKVLLVQGMLEENGIDAFVLNSQDRMYQFGEIKLMVRPNDVLKAKQLIIEHQENNNQ